MMRQTGSILVITFVSLLLGMAGAMEPTSVDVLENEWYEFQCDYNAQEDNKNAHELALIIQECSSEPHVATNREQLAPAVAVVFGKFSFDEVEIKTQLMNNQNWPLYYANPDNAYVRDGLVKVIYGDVNSISIRVNITTRIDRVCITCNQIKGFRDLEASKKESLKIRNPPTVNATVNGAVQQPTSPAYGVQINDTVTIVCTGRGPERLSVKLLQNDREIASNPAGESLTHVIQRASKESAGIYKCQAASDLLFLVQRGRSTGSLEFVLAVKFAPEFEVSEMVRYTQVGSSESIRIQVKSYPAATLTCTPSNVLPTRENYNDRMFENDYDLTLTNLDNVNKETTFDCTASNEVGQRQLRIRLTAKAPTPEILSNRGTEWSNSYRLEWQHDQNATIDYYQVEIVYKSREDNSEVNKTEVRFSPNAQQGTMALVDGKITNAGKLVHSGVLLNLVPDSNHDIRLRSCNIHGCSEYSPSISVKTPTRTADNFNDPKNPTKMSPNRASTLVHGSRTVHVIGLLFIAWPLLSSGVQHLLL